MDTEVITPKVKRLRTDRTRAVLPGQVSLFRGKIRMPISVTLIPDHRERALKGARRLGISRADFIALLIEKYAETVKL